METITWEIPRERWSPFLREVDAAARDRTVDVEQLDPELGNQPLAERVSLRGISLSEGGSTGGDIELELGTDGELDHRVLHPARVYVKHTASGALEWLDIEAEDHAKTLIRFEQPVPLPGPAPHRRPGPGEVLVRHYMTLDPRTARVGSSIAEADVVMRSHAIRHLPVVDDDGRLVGLLSDRDMVMLKARRGVDPEDVTVEETMSRAPYHVSPDAPLDEVAGVMARHRFGSAVVVEQGRVVGIFTTIDALRALVDLRARDRAHAH